jgi:hypothetical protein
VIQTVIPLSVAAIAGVITAIAVRFATGRRGLLPWTLGAIVGGVVMYVYVG